MLDGRRRAVAGRRAGRTSSPDFFRTIMGLGEVSTSLSSGELVSASSWRKDAAGIAESVDDREWEIFRAVLESRK